MIDAHAHLYDNQIAKDLDQVIVASQRAGIKKVYMPNLELNTIEPMLAVASAYPDFCAAMLGLHPCSVAQDYTTVLGEIKPWLKRHPFIAIGEIGLDFYWSREHEKEQIKALEEQLGWAKEYDLPVVLHARDSLDKVIEVVADAGIQKGVFHCFAGNLDQAHKIIEMGFHLGIGGIVTFAKSQLPTVVQAIPLQHLLLETDSPYLAPTPYRGKRNDPHYLPYIAAAIASVKNIPLEVVQKETTRQALALFEPQKNNLSE